MKSTFILISLMLCFACQDHKETSNTEIVSSIEANEDSERALEATLSEAAAEEKDRLAHFTTLVFDRLEHDFGTVKAESDNKTSFKVSNTGKHPLVILNVKASCGCTTPIKPKKPILPGKSDVIIVNFHPGLMQTKEQEKKVTVETNTKNVLTVLTIKAFVEKN
jgi:hypothetical protein